MYGGCAFVVIDHADRLFSFGAEGKNDNFLSQLLLMPKVMELNLTVIVVTTSVLLEFTRKLCVCICICLCICVSLSTYRSISSVFSDSVNPLLCLFASI